MKPATPRPIRAPQDHPGTPKHPRQPGTSSPTHLFPPQLSTLPNFQGFIPAASGTPGGGPDPPVPTPQSERGQWGGWSPPGETGTGTGSGCQQRVPGVLSGAGDRQGRGPGWRGDPPREGGLSKSGHGGPPSQKIPPGHGQDSQERGLGELRWPGVGGIPPGGKEGTWGGAQNVRAWGTIPPTSEEGVQLGRIWGDTLRRGGPGGLSWAGHEGPSQDTE